MTEHRTNDDDSEIPTLPNKNRRTHHQHTQEHQHRNEAIHICCYNNFTSIPVDIENEWLFDGYVISWLGSRRRILERVLEIRMQKIPRILRWSFPLEKSGDEKEESRLASIVSIKMRQRRRCRNSKIRVDLTAVELWYDCTYHTFYGEGEGGIRWWKVSVLCVVTTSKFVPRIIDVDKWIQYWDEVLAV